MNPLKGLEEQGQAVWLDFLSRQLVATGKLRKLIEENGLRGLTSNPAIFEKAIGESDDYDGALKAALGAGDLDAAGLFERLAVDDIQAAADLFRSVYDRTHGRDGFVSLEVSPYLATDTGESVAEARRLWQAVGRDNLMIKVPATAQGLPAIRQLIGEGINVNITLLFSQEVYEQVVEAYLAGLEHLEAQGGEPRRVASVASFFVSRIDTAVDKLIDQRLRGANDDETRRTLTGLKGKVAIANAKLAYRRYQARFSGARWDALAARGARSQRLLWASTGTKNPAYRDVLYVEELIGPDTVNTMPPATMDAFREHGRIRPSLDAEIAEAERTMNALDRVGISIDKVTAGLVEEGVRLFADAADKLFGAVAGKRKKLLGSSINSLRLSLPGDLEDRVEEALEQWRAAGKLRQLWQRDATLWTGGEEASWLGWLGIVGEQLSGIERLQAIREDVREQGFSQILLLGMGGSSLGPEVLSESFGRQPNGPELIVLDSTDPEQIRTVERRIDLSRALFIVSSKSGSTLEPNILKQYFFERARQAVGSERVGSRFIAITDPGSKLQQTAERDGFRHVFFGLPSIGGRYSVLSNFGMVPAAAMGLDVARFLGAAETMVRSCASSVPASQNPGAMLGVVLGVLASAGRDKVTLIASPKIGDLGAWLEQLLAESTGKHGKGLIPVDLEPLAEAASYGSDRLFVQIRLDTAPDRAQDAAVDALEAAGHPVVRISVPEIHQLGQEFFRWEFATAVAGAIIGIDPFDQPDVEASKVKTRALTDQYEREGRLPSETPLLQAGGLTLFVDPRNARELSGLAKTRSVAGYLEAHLDRLQPGDYCALLAYLARSDRHREALQEIRRILRDRKRIATCLGFGPRFLHSTGQVYKGGPPSGVFLQITCEDAADLDIPGQKYSFGIVKAAQARGDFEVLAERQRRALRVHLGADVQKGLAALKDAMREALS